MEKNVRRVKSSFEIVMGEEDDTEKELKDHSYHAILLFEVATNNDPPGTITYATKCTLLQSGFCNLNELNCLSVQNFQYFPVWWKGGIKHWKSSLVLNFLLIKCYAKV